MSRTFLIRAASIGTGIAFSLLYVALYRILIGGLVIYLYPYWPPPLAIAYVLGGILLQAWLCFRAGRPSGARLVGQVAAGILYVAALAMLPGHLYMS
jgi:hypothetical protein